jgi:hypothetical protein
MSQIHYTTKKSQRKTVGCLNKMTGKSNKKRLSISQVNYLSTKQKMAAGTKKLLTQITETT